IDLGLGGVGVRVLDYAEHALTAGRDAEAAAYLEIEVGDRVLWGAGISESIVRASLRGGISSLNRAARLRPGGAAGCHGQAAGDSQRICRPANPRAAGRQSGHRPG